MNTEEALAEVWRRIEMAAPDMRRSDALRIVREVRAITPAPDPLAEVERRIEDCMTWPTSREGGAVPGLAIALQRVREVRAATTETPPAPTRSVIQEWVTRLPMMQQTVLLTAVRGPDGLPKYHPTKYLLRWYRRCILLSALDGKVLTDPIDDNGGSFTGQSVSSGFDPSRWPALMDGRVTDYLRSLDEVPHHFQLHLMHAVEVLGFKHPDQTIRDWWNGVYCRLVHDMHLWPETEEQLDDRLGDSREGWLARGDVATND